MLCSGGTVDITLQEVLPGGNIKELNAPTGGGWGGNNINEEIEQIMISVFGNDFIQVNWNCSIQSLS